MARSILCLVLSFTLVGIGIAALGLAYLFDESR